MVWALFDAVEIQPYHQSWSTPNELPIRLSGILFFIQKNETADAQFLKVANLSTAMSGAVIAIICLAVVGIGEYLLL